VTDARGVTSYSYDDRDRLIEKKDPTGYELTYAYDAQGNRTNLTAIVGAEDYTTTYTYDTRNRIATVTNSQGNSYTLNYDDSGNWHGLAFPNGLNTVYTYDTSNRLASLSTTNGAGQLIQSYAYALSAAGNPERIDEYDGVSRHYQYDALNRLTHDRANRFGRGAHLPSRIHLRFDWESADATNL
jgi:YD repeat-containing protein